MCWIIWAYKIKNIDSINEKYITFNKSDKDPEHFVLKLLRLIEWNKNRWSDGYGISYYSKNEGLSLIRFKEINKSIKEQITNINASNIIAWIWHSRYQTSWWKQEIECLQPFTNKDEINIKDTYREFSFAFNWNIENSDILKKELEEKWEKEWKNYKFKLWWLDTEVLKFLIIDFMDDWITDLRTIIEKLYNKISGSCNIAILKNNWDMAIATDPNGFRPLTWWIKNWIFMFSSEEQALFSRWIYKTFHLWAGRIIEIKNWHFYGKQVLDCDINFTRCVFELIYFWDPKSTLPNWNPISRVRYSLWEELAKIEKLPINWNEDEYVVMWIPASANYSTAGYAKHLWLLNVKWIIKRPKSWRTFITIWEKREDKIKRKYEFALRDYVRWKKLILIDDSIVRWTTMNILIDKIKKEFEPSEIHIRIPAPAIIGHCPYWLDMHTRKELFAPKYSIRNLFDFDEDELEQMAKALWVESLAYLTVSSLKEKMEQIDFPNACMWCITWKYPTKIWQEVFDKQLKECN